MTSALEEWEWSQYRLWRAYRDNLQLTVSNIWAIRQNHCYLVPLDGADITFVLCSGLYLECSQDVQERKVGVNEAK